MGRDWSATFNAADQLTSTTDPLGRVASMTYDGDGRTAPTEDGSGRSVANTYDAAGQLTAQSFGDGTQLTYTYDGAGRRVSMTDPTGTTSYAYDPAGNLVEVTYPNGDTMGYSYDPGGRRVAMTYPDGSTGSYLYDRNDRLVSVTHSGGASVTYDYDRDGRLVSEVLSDGTTREYGYINGRLTSYTENGVTTTVTYDVSGRIVTTSGGESRTFSYDAAGQLTSAAGPSGTHSYTIDATGSVTGRDGVVFTVDAANQVGSSSDGSTYEYDEAGRLVRMANADGSWRGLSYDGRGLLIQEVVSGPETGIVVDPCVGAVATIVGTAGDDVIVGTNGDDVIFGLAGNDQIDGGNGRDLICGGDGNDVLTDGANSDDILSGGDGDDHLLGGNGVDVLIGGAGNDVLEGENGNDSLFGGSGSDTLAGGAGDDTLEGGIGADVLSGGNGNDTLQGGSGVDGVDGGSGDDLCEAEPGRVGCELDLGTGEPSRTVFTRSYDGDGLVSQVTVTRPDGGVDVYGLTWDRMLAVPEIVSLTVNGQTTTLLYGMNRALSIDPGGTVASFEYSVTGDQTSGFSTVASGFDPYGDPADANLTVGFGYRGELHIGGLVYLRNRDLDPTLARFTTADPLPGVAGTTTVANRYAYANNNPIEYTDPLGLRANDREIGRNGLQIGRNGLQFGDRRYDAFERLGVLEVAAFIPEERSELFGLFTLYLGDNRPFVYPPPADQSRFYTSVDFASGATSVQVSETCSPNGECWEPWPVKVFSLFPQSRLGEWPHRFSAFSYFVSQQEVFSLQWSVAHGDRRTFSGLIPTELVRPSFDGTIRMRWLSEDTLEVTYDGDCFPNLEAYVTLDDGTALALLRFEHRGGEQGLAIAGSCKVTAAGQVP